MTARAASWKIVCDEPTGCDEEFDLNPDWTLRPPAEVRAVAAGAGWTRMNGRDLCPAHKEPS